MKRIVFLLMVPVFILAGCSTTNNKNASGSVVIHPGVEEAWIIDGFAQPESVLSIPGHDWLYVSNINGEEEPGFISRIAKDGSVDEMRWVEGIQTPTGMGYWNGNIYVANQNTVEVISVEEGAIVKTLRSDAKSLNDISISDKGDIYVTDLDSSSIYMVEEDKLVLWIQTDMIPLSNGILVDDDDLIVLSSATADFREVPLTPDIYGSVYRINRTTREIELIDTGKKLGALDGVVPMGDGYVITDPFNGSLYYLSDEEKILMGSVQGGAADIGYDVDEPSVIYVPLLFAGKIAAYNVVDEEWIHITNKEDYNTLAADQTFGNDTGRSVATSGGIIKGAYNGEVLSGTWEWEGEFFSRVSTLGDMDLGHDNIAIYVNDTKMKLIMNDGKGMQVIDRKISQKNLLADIPVTAEKMWTSEDLIQVESVLSIPGHQYIYASVINQGEMGYVSKLAKDGTVVEKEWSDGIMSPAGMAYYKGFIYVADGTQVHKVELKSGAIVQTYSSNGMTLNDVTVSASGDIYVSNVFEASIYKIEGDRVIPWISGSAEFLYPNGVLDQGDKLIVGNMATVNFLENQLTQETLGSLYEVDKTDKSVRLIGPSKNIAAIDGVTSYGEGYLVSDPFNGLLFYADEKVKVKIDEIEGQIADIFADADDESILYIPMMAGNGVMAYKINK